MAQPKTNKQIFNVGLSFKSLMQAPNSFVYVELDSQHNTSKSPDITLHPLPLIPQSPEKGHGVAALDPLGTLRELEA